jgi:hypothetical protein
MESMYDEHRHTRKGMQRAQTHQLRQRTQRCGALPANLNLYPT